MAHSSAAEASRRTVPWGVALRHLAERQPGGTLNLVDSIRSEVGHMVGARPTFLNLYRTGDPEILSLQEQQRAWLLVTACGELPAEWGIADACLPPAWFRDRVGIAKRIRDRVLAGELDHAAYSVSA